MIAIYLVVQKCTTSRWKPSGPLSFQSLQKIFARALTIPIPTRSTSWKGFKGLSALKRVCSRQNIKGDGIDITGVIIFLVIGAVSGWLAGIVTKIGGFGLLGNIHIGIAGRVVKGFIFKLVIIVAGSLVGLMVTAIVGAVGLLYVIGLFKSSNESSI